MSVVVPTYNRNDRLQTTLTSIAQQSLAADQYEVIVVDDGSAQTLDPSFLGQYPRRLQYIQQRNAGATLARNAGAAAAQGDVLVFVDDDISLAPETLAGLADLTRSAPQLIALGTLVTPAQARTSVFGQLQGEPEAAPSADRDSVEVDFTECKTGLLAIRRTAFEGLGGFQDPGGGWPNWDDVDFGYRAHQRGFRFLRSQQAIGQHWDYALKDLATACRRWQAASRSAVRLFEKHPELPAHLPMFVDKTPATWQHDRPRLLARKLARRVASSGPMVWGLERLVEVLEQRYATPALLQPLYRWVIGGYIYRGYQQGLKEQA